MIQALIGSLSRVLNLTRLYFIMELVGRLISGGCIIPHYPTLSHVSHTILHYPTTPGRDCPACLIVL